MARRSPEREMSAFKTRVAALLAKEARCPACKKARAGLDPNSPQVPCAAHQRIRHEMAFPPGWRRYS